MSSSSCVANVLGVTPVPRFAQVSGGTLLLAPRIPVMLGKSLSRDEDGWAVAPLIRTLKTRASCRAPRSLPEPCVLVGSAADHPELEALHARLRPRLRGRALGSEGYLLKIDDAGVRIVANAPAGAFYGVQTLLQLLRGRTAPACEIADAPERPFRGIHMGAHSPERLPQIRRLIAEGLPRHKANAFVVDIGYSYRFKSHPEVKAERQFTRAQVRQLVRLARENNVKLIPLINCYGHQTWRAERIGALLRAYPEFNESPDPTRIRYCANWCPSNPEVYKVVFDLLDEIVDAFETDTIHLGMDEVFEFGQCPRCRGKSNAELFALAVNTLYDHVARKRGLKMLIWGDRLVDGRKTPYNKMNGARNNTHPARDLIPRDIMLCDWHYHVHRSYPSIDQFEKAGFGYVVCGWRKRKAVDALLDYAASHGRKHLLGCLATNWHGGKAELDYLVDGVTGRDEARAAGECFRQTADKAWSGMARRPSPPRRHK